MDIPDISRIVREDILRILGEREKGDALLSSLRAEIKVSPSFLEESIEGLVREDLIRSEGSLVVLTEKGQAVACDIVRKHVSIESYFKKTGKGGKAHKVAHVLEHYVSREVLNNLKKLSTLKKGGISITDFNLNEEGVISNIALADFALFERLVSMGIFPGKKILVTNIIPGSIIVETGNKKFALGEEIAKKIEVLGSEET